MIVNDGRLVGDYNPQIFKSNISTTNIVIIITVFSIVWILLYKFYFLLINEIFFGASVIGEIIYNIFLSVIGSSVFYFIVVYLPARRKREIINRVVWRRIGKLNFDYVMIMQDLYKLKNKTVPENLPNDFNEIIDLCQGVLLTDNAPRIHNNPAFQPENWFEYFEYYFALEKHNIEHLNRYWEEIPSEVKVLIDELESNTLWSGLELYKTTGFSNQLSALGGPIWTHLNTLRKINLIFYGQWNKL